MRLARFIRRTKDFSRPTDPPPEVRVKKSVFVPYINAEMNNRAECSVLESTSLSAGQLSEAAISMLQPEDRKGVVEFDSGILAGTSLTFEKDGVNHTEHGNLLGWPFLDADYVNVAKILADKVNEHEETKVTIF